MKLTKTELVENVKAGVKFMGGLAVDVYGESLNQIGKQAFIDAIEIGIENTIASLYEANVSEMEILRVVNLHWGIDMEEIEERLLWEKQQAVIRSLRQYMKLQGYSNEDMESFMREYKVRTRIRRERGLWKLKDNPEKLIKILGTNT